MAKTKKSRKPARKDPRRRSRKKVQFVAEWNKNNRACKTTWFTLYILNQSDAPFQESGSIVMEAFTFWAESTSATMRKIQARSLSIQMHNIFTLVRKAELEEGVDVEKAVEDMFTVFMQASKTMADLAAVNDWNYRFLGETYEAI